MNLQKYYISVMLLGALGIFGIFSTHAESVVEETQSEAIIQSTESNEWIKTDAVITEIERKSGKKNSYLMRASVDYTAGNVGEISSYVDIIKIPFYGPINSVGDTITISYQASNPALIHTTLGKILTHYGMYILIVLGIIFSIKPIMQVLKRKA